MCGKKKRVLVHSRPPLRPPRDPLRNLRSGTRRMRRIRVVVATRTVRSRRMISGDLAEISRLLADHDARTSSLSLSLLPFLLGSLPTSVPRFAPSFSGGSVTTRFTSRINDDCTKSTATATATMRMAMIMRMAVRTITSGDDDEDKLRRRGHRPTGFTRTRRGKKTRRELLRTNVQGKLVRVVKH